jgi:hypothetical protein
MKAPVDGVPQQELETDAGRNGSIGKAVAGDAFDRGDGSHYNLELF